MKQHSIDHLYPYLRMISASVQKAVRGKEDDVFAPVVAVAHKHKLYGDAFRFCPYKDRAEDIPGGIYPRKVRSKAVKIIKPSVKMVHLPVVLEHADDIKSEPRILLMNGSLVNHVSMRMYCAGTPAASASRIIAMAASGLCMAADILAL